MKRSVTGSSSLPAFSCYRTFYFTDLKAGEDGQQYALEDLHHHILPQDTETSSQLKVKAGSFEVFYPQDQFCPDSTGDSLAELDRK